MVNLLYSLAILLLSVISKNSFFYLFIYYYCYCYYFWFFFICLFPCFVLCILELGQFVSCLFCVSFTSLLSLVQFHCFYCFYLVDSTKLLYFFTLLKMFYANSIFHLLYSLAILLLSVISKNSFFYLFIYYYCYCYYFWSFYLFVSLLCALYS